MLDRNVAHVWGAAFIAEEHGATLVRPNNAAANGECFRSCRRPC
jgi:hypothetical protein